MKVRFYESLSGRIPVQEFIENLSEIDRSNVSVCIARV